MTKLITLCLLGFLSFLPKDIMATPQKVLFVYEDKHNFPFYMDKGTEINWKKPGVSIEMLKLVESKLNITVQFARQPWKRCKIELQNGRVDGIFNASFKPERIKIGVYPTKNGKVDPSRRITTITYVLYTLKDSLLRWDAKNKKIYNVTGNIGAPYGYSIADDLIKWGIPVEESSTTYTDFQKLIRDRVDGVAALELAGDFYLKKYPDRFKDIKKISPPLVTKPYYLMLSHQFVKKYPQLSEKIWNALAEIRVKEFNKIIQKYFQ